MKNKKRWIAAAIIVALIRWVDTIGANAATKGYTAHRCRYGQLTMVVRGYYHEADRSGGNDLRG